MGLLGGNGPTHEQRESAEANRAIGYAQGLYNNIVAAKDWDSLYTSLLQYQSGYVGGTSSTAVATGIRSEYTGAQLATMVANGDLLLPKGRTLEQLGFGDKEKTYSTAWGVGNSNPYYVTYTQQGFKKAAADNPEGFYASIQQGVSQSLLAPSNQAIASAIKTRVGSFIDTEKQAQVSPAAPGQDRPGVSGSNLTGPLGLRAAYGDDEARLGAKTLLGG